MNLRHLYYFWKVARHGGIVRASEAINITPQTLSGQIRLLESSIGTSLFVREGRRLALSDAGRLALSYADEIFALDAELDQALKENDRTRVTVFRVGVSDALPKALAYRLMQPAIATGTPVRIVCREWRIDRLLSELALHRLDMVLSDAPFTGTVDMHAESHRLGSSGIAFVATPALAGMASRPFPGCLEQLPLLVPGDDSAMRQKIGKWLDRQRLRVSIVGEFDDSALIATFGGEGFGAFPVAEILVDDLVATGNFQLLGRLLRPRVDYFGIHIPRRLTHPCVQAITSHWEKQPLAKSETRRQNVD